MKTSEIKNKETFFSCFFFLLIMFLIVFMSSVKTKPKLKMD